MPRNPFVDHPVHVGEACGGHPRIAARCEAGASRALRRFGRVI